MTLSSQPELFDPPSLARRLYRLGLTGVTEVEAHENRAVMVSVTPRGVLRIHRGYAYAPDSVLAAVVAFVRPGVRRRTRNTMERTILEFPAHAFVPPRRRSRRAGPVSPADRPILRELSARYERLCTQHFDGRLQPIRIRISRRMRRRLGELVIDPETNAPREIVISHRHVIRDGWDEAEHTLLHEMVHQWQAETGPGSGDRTACVSRCGPPPPPSGLAAQ
jgi:hypothetical protein